MVIETFGNILSLANINSLALGVITLHDVDTACNWTFITSGDTANESVSIGIGQVYAQLLESES